MAVVLVVDEEAAEAAGFFARATFDDVAVVEDDDVVVGRAFGASESRLLGLAAETVEAVLEVRDPNPDATGVGRVEVGREGAEEVCGAIKDVGREGADEICGAMTEVRRAGGRTMLCLEDRAAGFLTGVYDLLA